MKYLVIGLCGLLAACGAATPPPEPSIRTVDVKVEVPVPCPALATIGPEPTYSDNDAAIAAAPDIGSLAKLYAKGRLERGRRLLLYVAARTSCVF